MRCQPPALRSEEARIDLGRAGLELPVVTHKRAQRLETPRSRAGCRVRNMQPRPSDLELSIERPRVAALVCVACEAAQLAVVI